MIQRFKASPIGQQILRVRNQLLDSSYWRLSQQEFLSRSSQIQQLDDWVDLLWSYMGVGYYKYLRPNQDRGEITELARRVQAIQPRVIVELGTRDGATLLLWTQIASQAVVSIDLPGGIHGGGYVQAREKLYHLFTHNRPQVKLELVRADSQQTSTRERLQTLLAGQPIDFLFIDADHRYDGVKRDYQLYVDLVRSGGLIAFHDIRPNTRDSSIEVYRLWDEIKASGKRVEEIIHEPYTGRYGIGLVYQT